MAPPVASAEKSTYSDLAERLVAGDKRALARAISLVENDDPEGWALVRELFPRTGQRHGDRLHRTARRGQVHAHRSARGQRAGARPRGGRALHRSLLALHAGGAARRPHPPGRPLPRRGRVHPLDGLARLARGPVGGVAAGRAAHGRGRQGRRPAGDGRGGAGRGGHRGPRRHRRPRPGAGLRRLDPGAEGRGDGDPRRDRGQQGRPPAHRGHGPRRAGGAHAGARAAVEHPDRPHPGRRGRGRRGARREDGRAPRAPRVRGRARGAPPPRASAGGADPRRAAAAPAPRGLAGG